MSIHQTQSKMNITQINQTTPILLHQPLVEPLQDTSYGQFVTISDNNEIMCYSRAGNAIYYSEDDNYHSDRNILTPNKYTYVDAVTKHNQVYSISKCMVATLYGLAGTALFLIIFVSIYYIIV